MAVTLYLLPTTSFSQENAKACASISDDARRLLCFDLLFRKTSEKKTSSPGAWQITEEKSKLDDSRTVAMAVDSKEPIRGRFGRMEHARLVVRCKENKTVVYINFGGHFMSDLNHGTVDYRVDTKPAQRKRFRESTDHSALGLWGGAEAIPFLREMFDGENLFVRATPHSESPVSIDFNITGIATAITSLREACGWADSPRQSSQK